MSEPIDRRGAGTEGAHHPLFWAALAALLLNDHLLKGAGLLPGWMTGKLSDLAGLIVAPVVLAALLQARTDRRRALALGLVSAWFVAVNLFVPAAEATRAAAALVGFSWQLWVDPTDLLALLILPITWRVLCGRGSWRGTTARVLPRVAAGMGLLACLGSFPNPPDPAWNTAAFLFNDTDATLEVRVRWVESSIDCASVGSRFAEALPRETFGPGTTFLVPARHTLPLDRGVAELTSGTGGRPFPGEMPDTTTPHLGDCDVVLLTADGMPDTLVRWDALITRSVPETVVDEADEMRVSSGLRISQNEEGRLVLGAQYLTSPVIDRYDGGTTCRDYGTVTGFDWTELPLWRGDLQRIVVAQPTIDGCMHVVFAEPEAAIDPATGDPAVGHDSFVCVPPEDFPFVENSVVQIWNREDRLQIRRDIVRDDGTAWRTGELVVFRGVSQLREGPFTVRVAAVDVECRGLRMACGGFRVPGAGALMIPFGDRYVHPGETIERDSADGRRVRLRVGAAETMNVAHADCGAGRDELGPRLDAVVVYGEELR